MKPDEWRGDWNEQMNKWFDEKMNEVKGKICYSISNK